MENKKWCPVCGQELNKDAESCQKVQIVSEGKLVYSNHYEADDEENIYFDGKLIRSLVVGSNVLCIFLQNGEIYWKKYESELGLKNMNRIELPR